MDRLTQTGLLSDSDPRASGWFTDNVLHPFMNGTGVKQLYNNFASEQDKLAPSYVPDAKVLSTDWAVHSIASASGAVLTYALASKATGMGLSAVSSAAGLEGTAARVLTSQTTAQIVGAALFDVAKAPNPGETRLGNLAGSLAAFGIYSAGNEVLASAKPNSAVLTGLGRVAIGAAGGLASLETSHLVSDSLGVKSSLTWDDRFKAMASGGFLNVAMPAVRKGVSTVVDAALNAKPFQMPSDGTAEKLSSEAADKLPRLELENRSRAFSLKPINLPEDIESRMADTNGAKPGSTGPADAKTADPKAAETRSLDARSAEAKAGSELPKLILLKEQFDAKARQSQIERVAGELASFIGDAKKSLYTAIYDFRLKDPNAENTVINAFNKAANDGVDVRIAFFQPNEKGILPLNFAPDMDVPQGGVEEPLSSGPSPELLAKLSPKIQIQKMDTKGSASAAPDAYTDAVNCAQNAGAMKPRMIDMQKGQSGQMSGDVGTHGISGGGKLMHDKYVVRDAGTSNAAVWTGSTNFTDEAFGSQDNNIIQLKSDALAQVYAKDFQQMWDKSSISGTGKDLHTTINTGDGRVTVAFSPGDGAFIDAEYARRIEAAKNSVHIASMVISSPEILKALSNKIDQGLIVDGVYDGPQMSGVATQWENSGSEGSTEKLELWNKVKGHLVEKSSHPYTPHGPHDFMHNKMLSIDGQVAATGSFNMSVNATHNAENVLVIESPTVATQYQNYINDLIHTYGGKV